MIKRFSSQADAEIISSNTSRVGSFYRRLGKRLADFILATLGLLVFGPAMLFVGLMILLAEGSPVLFKQPRVGRQCKLFTIYKYRTMCSRLELGTTVTIAGDKRITSFGKFLRRYKIDELPQLLNVLWGEMSFVGPRPDVPGYADQLQGEQRIILSLRPGTLAFRNEEELLAAAADPKKYNDEVVYPEKIRLNVEYARTLTFLGDLRCIIKTIFK